MENLGATKRKLFFLQCGGYLSSVAPLMVLVSMRAERYVGTAGDGIRLGIGGGIGLVLIFLNSIGRLKIPSRLLGSGLVCLLAYLLSSLLSDILLLSAAYFAGALLESCLFAFPVKKAKEAVALGKTADATAKRVEEVLQRYNGRC
nr:MAG TPA: hypothetical protein [Caudoviricetes sp.]